MTTVSSAKPDGFDSFWQTTLEELAKLPAAPEIEEMPLRSTDYATAYRVRLTSIGPYRISGNLSVPKGDGPFPARYFPPRYGSVVDLVPQGTSNSQRRECVTFAIGVRGQRLSDQPYAASFPGLLTDGIDDLSTYVYRGIVADCCRGLEYLASREDVDGERIASIGADLALTTAALCPQITHLICSPTLSYAAADLATRTEAYPLEEINDYLRLNPSHEEQVRRTLSYFDLRWFAPNVTATTLLVAGSDGEALDASALSPMVESLGGECEVYKSTHSGFRDGVFTEEWLAGQLRMPGPSLPPHWQP